MNTTQKLIFNILAGSLPTPERGEYYPDLTIGLGGFGQRVVRHKKRLHQYNHKQSCLRRRQIWRLHKLLIQRLRQLRHPRQHLKMLLQNQFLQRKKL